jgi:hypothetical protein
MKQAKQHANVSSRWQQEAPQAKKDREIQYKV